MAHRTARQLERGTSVHIIRRSCMYSVVYRTLHGQYCFNRAVEGFSQSYANEHNIQCSYVTVSESHRKPPVSALLVVHHRPISPYLGLADSSIE